MLESTERALLRRIAKTQAESRLPSLAAAVVRDENMAWFGGRGRVQGQPPTADTQYRIGSITKTFTAVLVMRLRDEGRLELNDSVDKHLPDTPAGELTIGQLLAHTGGVSAEPAGEWWERTAGGDWSQLSAAMGPGTLRQRAGRGYHYSNLGFAVLGQLVAVMRGKAWADALQTEILDPLEMRRTTQRPAGPYASGLAVHPWADVVLPEPEHDAAAMAPAGQLWSTANDMGRWASFIGGDTGGLLHEDTLTEMREPATDGYGLGLDVRRARDRELAGHTGSMPGFLAGLMADPERSTGAVILANSTSGFSPGALAAELIAIVAKHEPRLPAEWAPMETADPALLDLTGQWYWGPSPYILRLLADGWLSLTRIGPQAPDLGGRFRPERDGTWTGLDGYHANETLRVIRGPDGSVSHLDVNTFVLTRQPYDKNAPIPGGLDPQGWLWRSELL